MDEDFFRGIFEVLSNAVLLFRITEDRKNFICIALNSAAKRVENLQDDEGVGLLLTEIFPLAIKLGYLDMALKSIFYRRTNENSCFLLSK